MLNAIHITPADIETYISAEYYFTAEEGAEFAKLSGRISEVDDNIALSLLTFCVLVLRNGYIISGESICVDRHNFNADEERGIARHDAVRKLMAAFNKGTDELLAEFYAGTKLPVDGSRFNDIREWAVARNLIEGSDSFRQMTKLVEEVGELAHGIAKNRPEEIADGIGDAVVVLTILAAQNGISIEECIERAWNEIKDRKGRMSNGVFIKDSDL